MIDGPLAALDAIKKATGENSVNLIGYCLGGTLSAATLAWLAQQKRQEVAGPGQVCDLLHHHGRVYGGR